MPIHKNVAHENYLQCQRCWKYFSDNEKLSIHIQSHEDVKCEYCDKTFKCNSLKRRHVKRTHEREYHAKDFICKAKVHKKFPCKFCPKICTSSAGRFVHTKVVHENYVQCKKCTKLFSDKEKCEVHQLQCVVKECSICKKNIRSHSTYKRHMKYVHKNNTIHEKDLSCDVCGKHFANITSQRTHFKLKHENYTKCKQCKKIFSDQEKLLIHQETHNCVKCKQCTKIFSDNEKLLVHQETHKEDKCAFCSKSFQSSSVLARRRHINLSHRNFIPCGKCSNIYSNLEKLTIHQQSHVKELPCKFCPKIFKSTEGLKKHLKLDHENYARCYKCAKMFSDKEEYKIHRMQCENKKECSVCFKSFGTQGGRDRHMKSVHKMDKSPKSC